jgi:hypothetical protein
LNRHIVGVWLVKQLAEGDLDARTAPRFEAWTPLSKSPTAARRKEEASVGAA